MSISDDEFEKLIGLVDANRAGLERLRMELEQLQRLLEIQALRICPRRTDRLEVDLPRNQPLGAQAYGE